MLALVPYTGTGETIVSPFVPAGVDLLEPDMGCIDLRPDPSVLAGFALVFSPSQTWGPGAQVLGDPLDDRSVSLRRALERGLGISLESRTFHEAIFELLLQHAREDGTRWRPLRPERQRYRVYCGRMVWEMPLISGGADYAESFNKADAATLGPDLTWVEVVGTSWGVTSNRGKVQATGDSRARASHDADGVEQFAALTVVTITATGASISVGGPLVRFSSSADTSYGWLANRQPNGGVNEHGLTKWVSGTETYALGGADATDVASGETLRIEVEGSTLRGYRNGTLLKTTTDTSIAGNTRGGMRGIVTGNGVFVVDDFSFGDLVAAAAYHRTNILLMPGIPG